MIFTCLVIGPVSDCVGPYRRPERFRVYSNAFQNDESSVIRNTQLVSPVSLLFLAPLSGPPLLDHQCIYCPLDISNVERMEEQSMGRKIHACHWTSYGPLVSCKPAWPVEWVACLTAPDQISSAVCKHEVVGVLPYLAFHTLDACLFMGNTMHLETVLQSNAAFEE